MATCSPLVFATDRSDGHAGTRDPVADVALVEGVEKEGKRVAVPEDFKSTLPVLVLYRGRGRGGCLLPFLLCPLFLRLVYPPEFRPALRPSTATCVVAAGEDGAVRELDGECTVFMC